MPRCSNEAQYSSWNGCYGIIFNPADGLRFEGEFRDGYLNGPGIYAFKGARYEGQFRGGNPHGRGVYHYADGNRYEGEFRDGKKEGRGIYFFADGSRYEGEFRDGRYNGRGIYYYANGTRYEGEYRDGKPDGQGMRYDASGARVAELWENGNFVRLTPAPNAQLRQQSTGTASQRVDGKKQAAPSNQITNAAAAPQSKGSELPPKTTANAQIDDASFCAGVTNISLRFAEKLSSEYRVDPSSIRFKRSEKNSIRSLTDKALEEAFWDAIASDGTPKCQLTIYSAKGSISCVVAGDSVRAGVAQDYKKCEQ